MTNFYFAAMESIIPRMPRAGLSKTAVLGSSCAYFCEEDLKENRHIAVINIEEFASLFIVTTQTAILSVLPSIYALHCCLLRFFSDTETRDFLMID
jgi:hypothetical protein